MQNKHCVVCGMSLSKDSRTNRHSWCPLEEVACKACGIKTPVIEISKENGFCQECQAHYLGVDIS